MAKKRPYGTGSVYKDKKTGTWKGQLFYSCDGKKKKKVFTRRTKRDAELALDLFIKQNKSLLSSKTRYRLDANRISKLGTLETEMKDWFKSVKKHQLKPTSFTRIYITAEYHIWPYLGHLFPIDITVNDVQNYIINRMVEEGYSYSSIKKAYDALSSFMEYYIRTNAMYDMHNVVKYAVLPRRNKGRAQTEDHYFSDDEICRYIEELWRKRDDGSYVYKPRTREILTILPNTGLRISECLGLKWKDWDKEAKILRIRRTAQAQAKIDIDTGEKKEGSYSVKLVEDSAKTYSSLRIIPLNDTVTKILTERYEREKPSNNDLIFPNDKGKPLSSCGLMKTSKTVAAAIGCPEKGGLHIMRHTYASALLRVGVSEKVVAECCGHCSTSVTTDTYMHVIRELRFSGNQDKLKFNPYPEHLIEKGIGMRMSDR